MSEVVKVELSEEDFKVFNPNSEGVQTETQAQAEEEPVEVAEQVEEQSQVGQEVAPEQPSGPVVEETISVEPTLIIAPDEPVVEKKVEEPTIQKLKKQIYKDEFQAALNNYYNSVEKPDVEAFTRAYYANYDNMSPTEIIRQEIMSDPFNKGLRPTAIAKLLNERLSKFDLDAEDPDDRADAEDLLRREAEIVKSRMIQAGKELVSKYSADLEIEIEAPVQSMEQPTEEEEKAKRDAFIAQYTPEVSKYIKNGVIQIQDKDGVINVPAVEVSEYVNSIANPVEFIQSLVLNPDGSVNLGKWIQFVTASKNLSAYNSAMIAHGVAKGQEKLASKIKNEAPMGQPRQTDGAPQPLDPVKNPNGFLQALESLKPYGN